MFLFFSLYKSPDGKVVGDLTLFLVRRQSVGMLHSIETHTGRQVPHYPLQAPHTQNEELSLENSGGLSGVIWVMVACEANSTKYKRISQITIYLFVSKEHSVSSFIW